MQRPGPAPVQTPNIHNFVTTAFDFSGFRVARNFGLVRGIIVRSRSVVGNITIYTELCEQARRDAYEIMIQHSQQMGANAIIGVRYDATEITQGVTEVLCYGTAVYIVPAQ